MGFCEAYSITVWTMGGLRAVARYVETAGGYSMPTRSPAAPIVLLRGTKNLNLSFEHLSKGGRAPFSMDKLMRSLVIAICAESRHYFTVKGGCWRCMDAGCAADRALRARELRFPQTPKRGRLRAKRWTAKLRFGRDDRRTRAGVRAAPLGKLPFPDVGPKGCRPKDIENPVPAGCASAGFAAQSIALRCRKFLTQHAVLPKTKKRGGACRNCAELATGRACRTCSTERGSLRPPLPAGWARCAFFSPSTTWQGDDSRSAPFCNHNPAGQWAELSSGSTTASRARHKRDFSGGRSSGFTRSTMGQPSAVGSQMSAPRAQTPVAGAAALPQAGTGPSS